MNILRDLRSRWCSLGLICLAGAFVAGCSGTDAPALAPVSGTVTLKGAPLAEAQVTLVPEKGPVAMGISDLEGKFKLKTGSLDGAVVGSGKVAVNASGGQDSGLDANMTPEDMQAMAIAGTLDEAMNKQNKPLINEKYTRADTSGITFDVKKGEENQMTVELQ